MFGGTEPVPDVLLDAHYGTVTLGQPLAAASLLNRLQAIAPYPLLNSADFETGAGFRLEGATAFPRNMAFGAAGDERLAYEAGRITAVESRAIGVQVNFAPVVDVNNNPRNPVINTRSYGEDPAAVGRLGSAYVRGLQAGGMIATLKHFPGHGDTDVDSHLGLPIINDPRTSLDATEFPPFKAGIAAGAGAVMTAHIEMPALDPSPNTPTTLSQPIVSGVLRREMGFDGIIYTDSMGMAGVTALYKPGDAAVRAIKAGNDIVLHSPDDGAAFAGIKAAVAVRRDLRGAVRHVGRADPAREGARRPAPHPRRQSRRARQHRRRPRAPGGGGRSSRKSITLVRDQRNQVPLSCAPDAQVLYLSILDYARRLADCGAEPHVHSRAEAPVARRDVGRAVGALDGERARAGARDGAALRRGDRLGVRARLVRQRPDGSAGEHAGRPARDGAADRAERQALRRGPVRQPVHATFLPDVPAILLTYDFYDRAERSAVKALAGEAPITGKLPIGLPGLAERGAGLTRHAVEHGIIKVCRARSSVG